MPSGNLSFFLEINTNNSPNAATSSGETFRVSMIKGTQFGYRYDAAVTDNYHWQNVATIRGISTEFAKASPTQVLNQILVELDNSSGWLDDYLPDGAEEQIWADAEVNIYFGGQDDDTVTNASKYYILDGSFQIVYKSVVFTLQDFRTKQNVDIATTTFEQTVNFDSATATVDGAAIVPLIIGDHTRHRVPAYLIAVSGSDYTYKVTDHEIGSVSIELENGTGITAFSTNYSDGEFTCRDGSGGYTAEDELFVECVGYPTDIISNNPMDIIEGMLTTLSSAVTADFYRGGTIGDWDFTKSNLAAVSASYYLTTTTKIMSLIDQLAYEAGVWIWVRDGVYYSDLRIYSSASESVDFSEFDLLDNSSQPRISINPKQTYANKAAVRYDPNPDGDFQGSYEFEPASGDVYDMAQAYGKTVVLAQDFSWVYGGVENLVQREIARRGIFERKLEITLVTSDDDSDAMMLNLNDDITIDTGNISDIVYRIEQLSKDPSQGRVIVGAIALSNLPKAALWLDTGGVDINGRQRDNRWGDNQHVWI